MATALAVDSATKKFEEFLEADNMADVLAQFSYNWDDLKKLQSELERMQSLLKEVEEKYNYNPGVNTTLLETRELGFNVEDAVDLNFVKALDGVNRAKLKAGQCELEDMQSTLREAATVNRLLSVIKGYACNVEAAIDPDFIEFMTRRRTVFENMFLVFCCNVDKRKNSVIYVLGNIGGIRDAYLALGLTYHCKSYKV
ncbi:hypothetical protein POM88_033206 [Heracleum sosnowskyi]|uniref:Disease resistance N-terminal domain-containing protein n=1 Tax=Heracleum sosnowskyi TaxID=360622 RepID=A0AAD8MM19_9APIA|nr:hypothetical protein POM88_033206 [Heracleum sosnowskyi]